MLHCAALNGTSYHNSTQYAQIIYRESKYIWAPAPSFILALDSATALVLDLALTPAPGPCSCFCLNFSFDFAPAPSLTPATARSLRSHRQL